MKHRTVIIITIILSLLLIGVYPASASTYKANSKIDNRESAPIRPVINIDLADILNILPEGNHDQSFGNQNQFSCLAEGWATDPDDRSIDLNVRVLSDGVEVAQTVAGVFRQDLDDAGVCPGGTCSFSVNLWGLISPDTNHLITEQAQDTQSGEWVNLNDTPKTLNCAGPSWLQADRFGVGNKMVNGNR
jgi:hypothetical protein